VLGNAQLYLGFRPISARFGFEAFLWLFAAHNHNRVLALPSNRMSVWVREPNQYLYQDWAGHLLSRVNNPPHGAACRAPVWTGSSWYSLSYLGSGNYSEIRAQAAQSLPVCPGSNASLCYFNYLGGLFLEPGQGCRFDVQNFGVDATPPTVHPLVISNAIAGPIPFAFGLDVFHHLNHYGAFASRVQDLPSCTSCPGGTVYGCGPCLQPFDTLWILDQVDVVDITLPFVNDNESGTPKIEVQCRALCDLT
jgi:hypothetical protein